VALLLPLALACGAVVAAGRRKLPVESEMESEIFPVSLLSAELTHFHDEAASASAPNLNWNGIV
jgi:hypothetical protein